MVAQKLPAQSTSAERNTSIILALTQKGLRHRFRRGTVHQHGDRGRRRTATLVQQRNQGETCSEFSE